MQKSLQSSLRPVSATGLRFTGVASALRQMQWQRGLRAGCAVGGAMFACHLLDRPMGWAALGALQAILVDNGGPLRSRGANILTVILGGSLAVLLGVLAGTPLALAVAVTFTFCFAATLARVLSQPFAACSVTVLVCYVVAVGGGQHGLAEGLSSTGYFIGGALWAALLSLVLWPADAFAPARTATAEAFAALTQLAELLPTTPTDDGRARFNEALARFRLRLEAAQASIAAAPARMAARTVRARNLTVLAENADLLLARLLRFAEFARHEPARLQALSLWLTAALSPIAAALHDRPFDQATGFAPQGSLWLELHRSLQRLEPTLAGDAHLLATLHDAQLSLEISYEALRAVWSGYETPRAAVPLLAAAATQPAQPAAPHYWLETLQANLTLRSVMFRHALRLGAVVALDVVITHFVRITHGYWLAMTSLIVLQPYTGETVRRSSERVAGTVAGAVLASLLAAVIHTEVGLLAAITLGAVFTLAIYAVDYAWYCFFLTPTIVMMTMPHLRDWHFAAIRMGMTCLGALVAVLAMLLLWPERESLQLPRLLGRCAAAEAAYLRAMAAFWSATGPDPQGRIAAERTLLAPARRLCGLATNDAEDTLDRALLEHALPLNPARSRTGQLNRGALTFTTYLRRLTQTVTAFAATGSEAQASPAVVARLAARLDAVAARLEDPATQHASAEAAAGEDDAGTIEPLRRLERQIAVLERTAEELATLHTRT